jgi:predicted phosphodiesterase
MKEEYKEICIYYDRRPKIYNLFFNDLVDYIASNPNCNQQDLNLWFQRNLKSDFDASDHKMVYDARKVINQLNYKIDEQDSSTYIMTLEDGENSKLKWKDVSHKKLLVLSDIHIPYHDKTSLMLALREGKKENVDGILLNGDILDFYHLSKFSKDHRKPTIKDEIQIFKFFVDQLKQRFPESTIYFKEGNHEIRLQRWLRDHAYMFDGMFDFEHIIDWKALNIVYLKDNIGVKIGKLHIIHGHEIRTSMGVVNIARTYYNKAGVNLMLGHWHQSQEYITRSMDGVMHGCWSIGCLCKLDADYTYGVNQWVNGFAIVEVINDKGDFRVKNHKIISGDLI